MTLQVTSLNVHFGGFSPQGRSRFDLAAASRALPGDVRVFQEVWHHPDEPSQVAVPEGWQVVEMRIADKRRPRKFPLPAEMVERVGRWSLSVVTHLEVVRSWWIDLPPVGAEARRRALALLVRHEGRDVTLVAVHLTTALVPFGSAWQLRSLAGRLPEGPLVVVGDHNLWARAARPLVRGMTLAVSGPTYEAPRPRHQLDQIWVRGLSVVSGEVLADVGSDHLPVTAVLDLP